MNRQTSQNPSAILYARVSTEEQASKGCSLKSQEDVLRQYCQLRNIEVQQIVIENHSAKTFSRPAWKKMMSLIQSQKTIPNLLLFTRWDRFSRNTGDSYSAIRLLQNLGINPQAIEQPLDLSVPENKMMLAFYLAIPEVENDRRGLNIREGMRKARESGKWLGKAPLGYKSYSSSEGSKTIIKKEPEASIIRQSFEQLSEGGYSVNYVYSYAIKSGLRCSRSHFWNLLRNPVYAGNIRIKTELSVIPGLHCGIVPAITFDKVQGCWDTRKSIKKIDHLIPYFHLKGSLIAQDAVNY